MSGLVVETKRRSERERERWLDVSGGERGRGVWRRRRRKDGEERKKERKKKKE